MTDECEKIQKEGPIMLAELNKKYNTSFESVDDLLNHARNIFNQKKNILNEKSIQLEKYRLIVNEKNEKYIWPLVNALFVIGGMIGALTSKYVLDYLGRKKGILFNCLFGLIASVIVFISPYLKSPICLMVSRLLFGIQGGMACSIV